MVKIIQKVDKSSIYISRVMSISHNFPPFCSKISSDLQIEKIAWESGFYHREPKKLRAKDLILGFWSMQNKGKNSLRNWSVHIGLSSGSDLTINKTGLSKGLTNSCVEMTKNILLKALSLKYKGLKSKVKKEIPPYDKALKFFNRILLQDSTMQKIPASR